MKRNTILAGVLVGAIMFPMGYMAAQEKQDTAGRTFAALYTKTANENTKTPELMALMMERYEKGHTATQSAIGDVQVASEASYHAQMLQVAQNRRIIELLEQIAAKK